MEVCVLREDFGILGARDEKEEEGQKRGGRVCCSSSLFSLSMRAHLTLLAALRRSCLGALVHFVVVVFAGHLRQGTGVGLETRRESDSDGRDKMVLNKEPCFASERGAVERDRARDEARSRQTCANKNKSKMDASQHGKKCKNKNKKRARD